MSVDFLTSDDLQSLRQNQMKIKTKKSSTKRYLILIYTVEYDRIYYPLSLHYCAKPDPNLLLEQIDQLARENQLLKSRVISFLFLSSSSSSRSVSIECRLF